MTLIEKLSELIEKDNRFILTKANPLLYKVFNTKSFIDLKKNIGKKGLAQVKVTFLEETSEGVEIKIEMELASYCEWETFFEGFVDNESDFERVLIMIGIL